MVIDVIIDVFLHFEEEKYGIGIYNVNFVYQIKTTFIFQCWIFYVKLKKEKIRE